MLLPATHARGTSRTQPRNHWSTYVFARASSRGAPSAAASLCIFVSDSSWLSASVHTEMADDDDEEDKVWREEKVTFAVCRARRA